MTDIYDPLGREFIVDLSVFGSSFNSRAESC